MWYTLVAYLINVGASPLKKTPAPSARYDATIVDHVVLYGLFGAAAAVL